LVTFYLTDGWPGPIAAQGELSIDSLPDFGIDQPVNEGPPKLFFSRILSF